MEARHIAPWSTLALAGLLAMAAVDGRTPPATGSVTVPLAVPKTVDVQMIGDASGYRFAPAKVTIQRGDQVRFTLVSGPPHNVVFWSDSIPEGASSALAQGMPKTVDELTGPFLLQAGEKYVVSFAKAPAGKYRYYCAPHLALGMVATIEVK